MKNFRTLIRQIFVYTLFSLTGFVPLCAQTIAISYYVDAGKGKDTNNGTSITSPFKTIAKAKETVRKLDKTRGGDIIVYLREGDYIQENTLVFDENDGGSKNCQVVYKNYKDEVPVISGGKKITGWKLYDKSKNIYRAPVKTLEFRQLYVNGSRAVRARQPNLGESYCQIVKWDKDTLNKKLDIIINKAEISGWKNLSKVEIITLNSFTTNHLRLSSFTSDDKYAYVKIQDAEGKILFKVAKNFWKLPYFFENAYEFVDTEGEWYLNVSEGFVYYKPLKNENMNDVEAIAPYLETVMKVEGLNLDKPVKNLQFQGIEFSYSTWLWPDKNGCVEYQAFHPFSVDQKIFSSNTQFLIKHPEMESKYNKYGAENNFTAPAGVYVAKADYITFEQCSFKHMGANGINLNYGTHFCKLNGNVVFDISGNGISEMMQNYDNVGGMECYNPKDIREVCSNDVVSNNYITFCGMDYKGAVGIFCGYTRNVTIIHNEVCKMPYDGISVGWGWTELNDTTVMKNNRINYNSVHHVNSEAPLNDGGGIYTLSDQPNSECRNNYSSTKFNGLYFDEGTSHYTISNNVVETPGEWISFWSKKQHDNVATDNYSSSQRQNVNGTNCTVTNTVFVPDKKWPKEALDIIRHAGLEENYKDIINKLKIKTKPLNVELKPRN